MSMSNGENRPLALVVEDVDWIREGMVRQLKECGYDVAEAADAGEALALAERVRPALILTEEELPTYASLVGRLGEHPALARVPVIIINPDFEDGTRCGDSIMLGGYERIAHLLAALKT
jgi:CheY-like chemotaxis protein